MNDDLMQELYWFAQYRDAVRMLKKEGAGSFIHLLEENAAVCQAMFVIYSAQYWASVRTPHVR